MAFRRRLYRPARIRSGLTIQTMSPASARAPWLLGAGPRPFGSWVPNRLSPAIVRGIGTMPTKPPKRNPLPRPILGSRTTPPLPPGVTLKRALAPPPLPRGLPTRVSPPPPPRRSPKPPIGESDFMDTVIVSSSIVAPAGEPPWPPREPSTGHTNQALELAQTILKRFDAMNDGERTDLAELVVCFDNCRDADRALLLALARRIAERG